MKTYKLAISGDADRHLDGILDYGAENWGDVAAISYYRDLLTHFDRLCDNPFLYVAVDEIKEGYRRSVCAKHSIYYRVVGQTVEIMAVLRSQDIQDYL